VAEGEAQHDQVRGRGYTELPGRHITVNQVVAYNMAWLRKAAGMTQAELGEKLGWSFRAVSAAERTWDRTDGKGRVFDADLIVALARVFDVPVIALLLPPVEDGTEERYLFHPLEPHLSRPLGPHGDDCLEMRDLAGMLMPDSDLDYPVMAAYRARLTAMVATYLEPSWGENVRRWLTEDTEAELLAEGLQRIRWEQDALRVVIADLEKLALAIEKGRRS
jgi:transcriptional regulator with XRE-family HTH domain